MTTTEEVWKKLRTMGWRFAKSQVNGAGRMVDLIRHDESRKSIAMFHKDAADLASGRATLEQIIERNKGADLADPWAVEED